MEHRLTRRTARKRYATPTPTVSAKEEMYGPGKGYHVSRLVIALYIHTDIRWCPHRIFGDAVKSGLYGQRRLGRARQVVVEARGRRVGLLDAGRERAQGPQRLVQVL